MPNIDAESPATPSATPAAGRPPREPRLDNRLFAIVLAAMFAVLVTMFSGLLFELPD